MSENNVKENQKSVFTAEYSLTYDEVKTTLYSTGKRNSHFVTSMIQSTLGVFGLLLFVSNMINNPSNIINYIVCAVCLVFIVFSWVWPARAEKKVIQRAVGGKTLSITVSEDKINVKIDQDEISWDVFLNGESVLSVAPGLLIIHLESRQLLSIPERAFQDEDREQAIAYIKQGTRLKALKKQKSEKPNINEKGDLNE